MRFYAVLAALCVSFGFFSLFDANARRPWAQFVFGAVWAALAVIGWLERRRKLTP